MAEPPEHLGPHEQGDAGILSGSTTLDPSESPLPPESAAPSAGLPAPPPSPRRQVLFAALLYAAAALVTQSGSPGLGDTDPYRHLAYADQLWRSGFTLRGHPFLPLTLLGDSGVDLWWGFHLLLVPFTPLGVLWGARVAGALIAATAGGALALVMHRYGSAVVQRRAALFSLLPLGMSSVFVLRDALARPAHLTLPLLLVALLAGAGEVAWGWAALAGALHLWLHLSAPLSPLFAGLGWLAAWSVGRRGPPKAVLASLCGLALAALLRPDRAHFVQVAVQTNLGAMGLLSGGLLPHAGVELSPPGLRLFFEESGLGLLAVAAALLLSRGAQGGRRVPGAAAVRRAVWLALGVALVLALRSARFFDYSAPLLALAAALHWPSPLPESAGVPWWRSRRAVRAAGAALALAGVLLFARSVEKAWTAGQQFVPPPQQVASFAAQVRAQVPPGALLFVDDLFLSCVLYAALPDYQYVGAYEPALLYLPHPALFWSWHHAVVEGVDCQEPTCAKSAPSAAAVARAVDRFSARWVVTSYPPGPFSMQTLLLRGSGEFALAGRASGGAADLFLWRRVLR